MTEVRKVAHNTIIQTIGKAVSVIIGLFAFGLIARNLGQVGYGYFTTVYVFLTIFGVLIDLGLQMTTTKLISNPNNNEAKILNNVLTIRLFSSIIFLGLACVLVFFFPYPTIIKFGVVAASLGFIFAQLNNILTSLFQKYLVIYKIVIADLIAKFFYLGFLLLAIYWQTGLMGIIAATVLDSLITLAVLIFFCGRYVKLRLDFDFTVWLKILNDTWPIALTIALNLIYFKGDLVIMSLMRSQAEVGLYGAPYRVLEVLIGIIYLFLGLVLPIMSAAVAIKNFEKLKKVIQAGFDFLITISIPLFVGGLFLGQKIMIFMAGIDFAISGEIIKILLIATGTIFIAGLFGYAVVALNQQKKMIKFYALNALLSIIAYLIFIPIYSYWAAAWITVISEFFIMITALVVVNQTIKFLPDLKIIWQATLASLVMAIFLNIFIYLNFIILIGGGAIIYFAALYLIGGVDKKTILEITKLKAN